MKCQCVFLDTDKMGNSLKKIFAHISIGKKTEYSHQYEDGYNNKFGNYDDFRNFEKEVKRRGYDWDLFEEENKKNSGARLYDTDVIEEIKSLLLKMGDLPEQPPYHGRAVMLLEQIWHNQKQNG